MAKQELDLSIHYCPGKQNSNADAFSRSPLPEVGNEEAAFGIISALDGCDLGEMSDLPALQRDDPELAAIIRDWCTTRR